MKTSVVVASYQQARFWPRLCQSLSQDTESLGEVILVEDGWLGPEYPKSWYKEVFYRWLPAEIPLWIIERDHGGFGLSKSLNLGCQAAHHEMILIMEGDEFFWGKTLTEDLRLAALDPSILLAGIKTYVDLDDPDREIELDHRLDRLPDYRCIWWWCSGGHLMFHKSAWERVGGFDEEYGYGLHDFDYAARHCREFSPQAVIYGGGIMAHHGSGKGRAAPDIEAWNRFSKTLVKCFGPNPCMPH